MPILMTDCRGPGAAMQCLEEWYATPLGRELAVKEAACLERMLCDTFGYYLLQVGLVGAHGHLAGCRIRNRILLPGAAALSPALQGGRAQVIVDPCRLPIASDSIDAVVLPHVLEFAEDARQVLREAERVLIPEGRVILLGFNNLSLWGLRRQLARGQRQRRVPWCGNFLTPFRVADWLSLLGFDVEVEERMMFRPPWRRTLFRDSTFFDAMGQRLWPTFAGVFAIRAVKRVSTLTPLKPSWRQRRALLAGHRPVRPTVRLVRPRPGAAAAPRPPERGAAR